VLAVRKRRERVPDARRRISGGVDDDADLRRRDHRERIIGDVRGAGLGRLRQRARREALLRPAGALERGARAVGREIGDADDEDAGGVLRLREIHRAELAGADQTDAQRVAALGACAKQTVEIHEVT
jgi:hypothetical protein